MAQPVVSYDKDLPEIPERLEGAHLPPKSYLRRRSATDFEVVPGRRPSDMFLVNRLRDEVGKWRESGYEGASLVTRRLFTYWFEESHLLGTGEFHFYFGQREAIETLVYLLEIRQLTDSAELANAFGEVNGPTASLIGNFSVNRTPDGNRRLHRLVPSSGRTVIQDLPPADLARFAVKMATGSGKTVVMAMAIAWSYFHKRKVAGSRAAGNFLIVAPNVIVYQRLERDYGNSEIFHNLPLIPSEWKGQFSLKTILRGDASEPDPSGNLVLVNVQQIHESSLKEWTPANAIQALLGKKPSGAISRERPLLKRLQGLPDLAVLNDEAHHVHDEDLAWHKTLMALHRALPGGLRLWLDFSATPKDQAGTYFPWVICDYPLAQAVEDRIVKAPLIVHRVDQEDPPHVSKENLIEVYGDLLQAALERLKVHRTAYKPLGLKPVLFIMTEKNAYADVIGEWLRSTPETGMSRAAVCVIHTKNDGNVRESDLEEARQAVRDIDRPDNKIQAIVSVLMLREGWDVRSVSIVLGLRPFTAEAKILPEQAVGRGLRLMEGVGPDRTQTLEVMGSRRFEEFVKGLEIEGVGIQTSTSPTQAVIVYPMDSKLAMDIAIPITGQVYERRYDKLADLDPLALSPISDGEELAEPARIKLKMDFATTQTEVHQANIAGASQAPVQEILATITNKVGAAAHLNGVFADLFPLVESYVVHRCFGRTVDIADDLVISHLRRAMIQQAIADYLGKQIGSLTAEAIPVKPGKKQLKLSSTTPFQWRRDLPLFESHKTIFSGVATFNPLERRFATFLHHAGDIVRFAALGTTGQESGAKFRVEFIKPSGALGLYHPDFVAVQQANGSETNWIIETKGRAWEDVLAKDAAIGHWCDQVSKATPTPWRFLRVNQTAFDQTDCSSFSELIERLPNARLAQEPMPFDEPPDLGDLYDLVGDEVSAFMREHPILHDLAFEAHTEIRSLFGTEPLLLLKVLDDPDDENEPRQLALVIETSASRSSARTLLRQFDERWWIEAMPKAGNLMTISLEYR